MLQIQRIIDNDKILQEILKIFKNNELYLVGGYVRDAFFNKMSADKDIIICDISAKSASLMLAEKLNGHFVELDPANSIYRVVLQDKINYVDIVNPVDNSLEKDILRRDFTFNTICYNCQNKTIIDNLNGIVALENKQIIPVDESNFLDDPLRLLRAFRFLSVLDFEISEETLLMLKKYSKLLATCAKERINIEITKLFGGKNAHNALILLDKAEILEFLFPQIAQIKKIPPNSHHHLNLFYHSIETVKQIQYQFEKATPEVKEHILNSDIGQLPRLAYLKLAGFLHDIGKPKTWTIEPNTLRHRFIKHDEVGAELVLAVLKPLKYSNKQIDYIKTLVKHHIYPSALVGSVETTQKAKIRFFRKLENNVPDVILLAQADRLSARGKDISEKIITDNINNLNELMDLYFQSKAQLLPLPKLLSGYEIMNILKIKQSPLLGKIITALKEEQLNGNITTKEEALNFVKQFAKTR